VFHISLLKKYNKNEDFINRPSKEKEVIQIDNPIPQEYEVERITGQRVNSDTKQTEYLVVWKGFPESEATWEPHSSLEANGQITEALQKWLEDSNKIATQASAAEQTIDTLLAEFNSSVPIQRSE
jgi:hypothetical protein